MADSVVVLERFDFTGVLVYSSNKVLTSQHIDFDQG